MDGRLVGLTVLWLTAVVVSLAAGQVPSTASPTATASITAASTADTSSVSDSSKASAGASKKTTADAAGQAAKAPLNPPPKPAAQAPEKVGFARVTPAWPKWLTLTLTERGRYESSRPPATKGAAYDSYYLNRFRMTAGIRFSSWAQATFQGQDSRILEYETSTVLPSSLLNRFDLRLAYVELGQKATQGISALVGRQELTYGDGRLMASPDWGNVSRTYDSVRFVVYRAGVKVDTFFGAPVDVTRGFSMAKVGERVAGAWATFDRVKPLGYIETYALAKSIAVAVGELGGKADAVTYAMGVRTGGPITKVITWEADNVYEAGHYGRDDLAGFGTHEAVNWNIGKSAAKPKATVEYNYASGDSNASDGTRGTFDQMYASTHAKWGMADLVGWRNMHHAAAKLEFSATTRLKVNTGLNHFWLATVQDSWYAASGVKAVLNRKATSRDVGWEPDVYIAYTVTRDLTIGAGAGVLLGGGFLKQSTDVTRLWAPYTTFTYKF